MQPIRILCGRPFSKLLRFALALLALGLGLNTAAAVKIENAQLFIASAAYANGRILITGSTFVPNTIVRIAGTSFQVNSGPDRIFQFDVGYAPPSCAIDLASPTGRLGLIFRACAAPPFAGTIRRENTCFALSDFYQTAANARVCVARCLSNEIGITGRIDQKRRSDHTVASAQVLNPARLGPDQPLALKTGGSVIFSTDAVFSYRDYSNTVVPINPVLYYAHMQIYCQSPVVQ
jgi:hypothetical protein